MSSDQIHLTVPEKGSTGKRVRPKSPRRKAPSAPKKKKKSSLENDTQSNDIDAKSHDSPNEGADPSESEHKGMKRSVSPRKEQYMSLLDEMVGQGDMVLLDPITEDSILHNLNKRYAAGEIYVSRNCIISEKCTIKKKKVLAH